MAPHLPLLRAGRAYRSLDTSCLRDLASGEPVLEVSQANPGLIARDLDFSRETSPLDASSVADLGALCRRASRRFLEDDLPLDGERQSPQAYVRALAATTGLPHRLGLLSMQRLAAVLAEMDEVVHGLTRGLDTTALDDGFLDRGAGRGGGGALAFQRTASHLGCVLPSNSPGVHGLWLPAIALKIGLVLKPGSDDPWTPWRLAQALLAEGLPPEAISFYPGGHDAAAEVLLRSPRSLLFGDGPAVDPWRKDPRVQVHGPGRSKILLDEGAAARPTDHLDLIVESVLAGAGRSCLNTSSVRLPGNGVELAHALADRLATVTPLPLDHPDARLAAMAPERAQALSQRIDELLEIPGGVDMTRIARKGKPRVQELDGLTFLLPTVIGCTTPSHPLADLELPFPFVSIVETPQAEMAARLGPSLVVTVLGDDPALRQEVLACPAIDRLNLGPVPTTEVRFDQPHEGNLFGHLYRQRSLALAPAGGAH